jgi:PTS system nitrogen regulatory IIA component
MQVTDLISPDRIACGVDAQSKKRALETLSDLIAKDRQQISSHDVFDSLLARERLGATGVGHGVAIPHGRLRKSEQTIGALIRLKDGIDFGALDNEPVDLLFALLVPEESTEEHLQILSSLATLFSDAAFREKVRNAKTPEDMYKILTDWSKDSG